MTDAVVELVSTLIERNALQHDDLISIVFTSTPDLRSEFPAAAARTLGLGDVPLLCAQELDIAGALPRVVRAMVHVETDRARADIVHVYLRGAEVLRRDLAQ
jgi:chorismate mutase